MFYFTFSLSYSLYLFSCFIIPLHSTRIAPLRFLVGCRKRRLNLALVVCVVLVFYVFLAKDTCLFLRLCRGVIFVLPGCRSWHNKLNEPLDPFPFLWPFVSDIAIFVLKGDLNSNQLTPPKNYFKFQIIPTHMVWWEIIPGRKKRVWLCPL